MGTELQKHARLKSLHANETFLHGTLVIGATGAISQQSGMRDSGVTFAQNGTGRYDGTIHRGYRRAIGGYAQLMGATAGTVPSAAKEAFITGVSASNLSGASGITTFTIQCTAADSATATNPANGDIVTWELVVSESP
ncbi:hypothetical protein [Mycobacterium sp.]|uniref:hypothetical protein n=1 Tax=Mycobacterium sp. TaxID=1785 RepID=UPI002601E53A|nr:hypothetical protein [Mycobacterium sp.]